MHVYKQVFISGRVQGVFFRESTRQKANELSLAGGVRNLSDGRVEVQVTGEETVIQCLINWLKIGPKYAKVSTIEVIDLPVETYQDALQALSSDRFEVWATK